MKNALKIFLVLIVLLGLAAVLYFFNPLGFGKGKNAALAEIIHYEDVRFAPNELITYLSDKDPDIRARAALAVGRIDDPKTIESLFPLLNDSSEQVTTNAAFAIGLSGKPEYARTLIRNCDIYEAEERAAVVRAVGYLADSTVPDVYGAIKVFLSDPDHRVREQAAMALFRSRDRSAAPDLINICRNDPVRTVRVAALYALVRLRSSDDLGLYADWLPDSDPFVRSLALRGLSLSRDTAEIRDIAGSLNDRDNGVVAEAITSLSRIESPRAVKYLYDRYIDESDENLRVLFLQTFSRLKNDIAEGEAMDAVHADSSINIKAAAIEYLLKIRGPEMLALSDSLLDLKNQFLTMTIIQALAGVNEETVELRLKGLADDSSAVIRAYAFDALCMVDSTSAAKVNYNIDKALGDTSYVVVMSAVDYIGQHRLSGHLPQLNTILKMENLAHPDLRRSVVQAAASILEGDTTLKAAEELLFMGLHDKDYVVSHTAAEAYKNILGVNKSQYISRPKEMASVSSIKSFLNKYNVNPHAIISTSKGDIELELYADIAPLAVINFIRLAGKDFYKGIIFHRVIPNFVIQAGDPYGIGIGGPGYEIRGEPSDAPFDRGALGMADSGMDTGGSQFFITLSAQPHLEGRYTLFGQVITGMNVVDQIVRGDTIKHIAIRKGDEQK